MKNYKERNMIAIEAIENTLKELDINYHKPLIALLTEYDKKLKTQDNSAALFNSLAHKIPMCILENKLKIPKEVTELIATLNSLLAKEPSSFLAATFCGFKL